MALRAASGVLAVVLMAACCSSGAQAAGVGGSADMTAPCYTNPSADSCATFERSAADWTDDLEQLCQAMPYMIGCSLWAQCKSGQAKANSPYCSLPSLVGAVCVADAMSRMNGCEAYNGLCGAGTKVQQCLNPGVPPAVPTTFGTKADVDGICTSHSMDGCQDCSSVGRTNFAKCPEVLDVLSKLCTSMPGMPECTTLHTFCANSGIADGFPMVCTQNAADGSTTSMPPMKMWYHQSTRDIFLFKEWVPSSTGQYIGLCIAMCVLAVFTQFLKALRLRVEMRWAAQARARQQCCCAPADDLEAASAASKDGTVDDKDAAAPAAAAAAAVAGGSKSCCSGGLAAVAPESGEAAVPTSSRQPAWRRQGALTLCGRQLITRDQARRNFWRASFTFVVIFLDYALMLVVMTFNIGIILAVCGGFAIGALLFGHAGEKASTSYGGANGGSSAMGVGGSGAFQPGQNGPLSRAATSSSELEAVFVEGSGCCSGGSGCGGGAGHGGGQL